MTAKRPPAWLPAKWEPADCEALQALSRGEASPDQQKRALDWIITKAGDAYGAEHGNPFRSEIEGGAREEAFLLGRHFVGQQIVKLVNLPRQIKEDVRTNAERRNRG